MKRKIYDLKNKRAGILTAAEQALEAKEMEAYKAKMQEIQLLNTEIQELETLEAEKGRFEEGEPLENLYNQQQQQKADELLRNKVDKVRAESGYANAWADALKNGISVKNGRSDGKYGVLYNALTESGGTPAGADGGFLVPIEFDNLIHQKMKEFIRLADFFNEEKVNGLTGWRAVEKAKASKALPSIDEIEEIDPDDQPGFEKVPYAIKKYGDIIVVSSELMEDNTAGLMAYLANWFAPKVILTENSLLLALLDSLTATSLIAGKEVAGLKSALNKGLNTAHSKTATIICNQDSYDILDNLVDTTGRGLLVPNPADPDVYRFKGRKVTFADNDLLPTADNAAPIYIGNFKAFGTLFRRKALEFASTNIGGKAWRTDTTEVRGIVRMDASKMDAKAAVKKTVAVS